MMLRVEQGKGGKDRSLNMELDAKDCSSLFWHRQHIPRWRDIRRWRGTAENSRRQSRVVRLSLLNPSSCDIESTAEYQVEPHRIGKPRRRPHLWPPPVPAHSCILTAGRSHFR